MKPVVVLWAVLAASALGSRSHAEGDAAAGEKIFNRCRSCHVADKEQNRVGPHLVGVVGRPVASVDGYRYSAAMAARGAEGAVWNEEDLAAYLTSPKAFLPGGSMAFPGLKRTEDVENVIAYLKSVAGR